MKIDVKNYVLHIDGREVVPVFYKYPKFCDICKKRLQIPALTMLYHYYNPNDLKEYFVCTSCHQRLCFLVKLKEGHG